MNAAINHLARTTESAVDIKELSKHFGGFVAVDKISFDVNKGEVLGLLGPNGAGKTTTIRMLTGLSRPTGGRVSILGLDVRTDITAIKKRIGVVPENSNLYDELSAADNLLFMTQLYGVARRDRKKRTEDLLRDFGLFERRKSHFRTFSRGMKRALTVAAALVHEPEILFLDEPTVGLDVVAARSLRNLIRNLRRQGITLLLTTHYLEEAEVLCDRVVIIAKGKILEIDTPRNLINKTGGRSLEDAFFTITKLEPTIMSIEKGK